MSQGWLGIENKVAIVTGAASGIGLHVAHSLKKAGAKVVMADLNVETGLKEEGHYLVQCDISKRESAAHLIDKTVEVFGTVDILVNNAGVNLPRLLVDERGERPEYEISEKDFDFMVDINQKGTFLCSQAAARIMIKKKSGVIVNVASEAGQEGSAGQSVYSATKAAVIAFTRAWAKELGKFGVRVVGIAPGILEETGLRTDAYNEALAYTRGTTVSGLNTDYSKSIPLGREGKLDEVADLVAYLASDRSSYITGTTINISGGKSRG